MYVIQPVSGTWPAQKTIIADLFWFICDSLYLAFIHLNDYDLMQVSNTLP